jgi:hypothetical protein
MTPSQPRSAPFVGCIFKEIRPLRVLKGRIFDVAVDLRRRDAISVVSDQRDAPSNAFDIADGLFKVMPTYGRKAK